MQMKLQMAGCLRCCCVNLMQQNHNENHREKYGSETQKVVGHWSGCGDITSVMWLQLPTKSKRNAVVFRVKFPFESCRCQYLDWMAWLHSCGQGSNAVTHCRIVVLGRSIWGQHPVSPITVTVCRGQGKTPTTLKGCDVMELPGTETCLLKIPASFLSLTSFGTRHASEP